jgi:hypothetical protein
VSSGCWPLGKETVALADQAAAQDIVNLLLVAPYRPYSG